MPPAPAVATPTAVSAEALPGHLTSLRRRLSVLRRKYMTITICHGVLVVLGAVAATLAGEMLFDWLVDLPWVLRLLVFLGGIGTAGYSIHKRILDPWRHRPGEDAVALMIERAMPIFRGRYIASIQLARDPQTVDASTAPGLIRALVAQTVTLATGRRFGHVVSTRQLKAAARRAAGGAVILGIAFAFSGVSGRILLRRALLSNEPVPTKTRVVNATGDRIVAAGDDLTIEASAGGFVPGRPGRLIVTDLATRERGEFLFAPAPGRPGRFARLVTSVQRPFDYQIRLGDGKSAVFHITTRPRPTVASLEAEQIFPAYARMTPVRRSLNDLSLLAGSRLRLRCRASVDVQAGSVRLTGDNQPAPVPMERQSARELTAELPITNKNLSGFSVSLVDPAGIETKDPTVYRIDVVPDQPPTVRITYPVRQEELVTARARMLIAFEAADDLGVARLGIHYKITGSADAGAVQGAAEEKTLEMDLGNDRPRDLRRRYEWRIGELQPALKPGATIEYWLVATDANDVSGPGVGQSEHVVARVVTDQEKLADLMNRAADVLGGVGDVAGQEEELNQQLGGIIKDKVAAPP